MPVDVIDLLSSPDVAPRPLPTTNTSPPGEDEDHLESRLVKDEWFILSSDDDAFKNAAEAHQSATAALTKPLTDSNVADTQREEDAQLHMPVQNGSRTQHLRDDNFLLSSDDLPSPSKLDELPLPSPKRRRLDISPGSSRPIDTIDASANKDKGRSFKRSVSNMETASKPAVSRARERGFKRSNTMTVILDSDPIVFTSSPDINANSGNSRLEKKSAKKNAMEIVDLENISDRRPLAGRTHGEVSSRHEMGNRGKELDFNFDDSDSDLPDINGIENYKPRYSYSSFNSHENTKEKSMKTAKSSNASEAKKAERKKKAEEKALEKEAEKERKRLEKEGKLRERERAAELAKVNTLRTDKKISAPEMIVDIPSCLEQKLAGQVKTFLGPLNIESSAWQSDVPVVKWRRKVVADFNEEMGMWEPVRPYVRSENHVLLILYAQDFVELVLGEEGRDLDAHMLRLKAKFEGCTIIYLIEGLVSWMRKNRNVRNREFTEAVRSQMNTQEGTSQRSKKRSAQEYVDEDLVEDALLRLQVIHGALIHHTASMIETSEWVVAFTQHISTIPYR